jgi:hypothetical protein
MSIKLEHLIDLSNGCTCIQLNPILGLVVADKSMHLEKVSQVCAWVHTFLCLFWICQGIWLSFSILAGKSNLVFV